MRSHQLRKNEKHTTDYLIIVSFGISSCSYLEPNEIKHETSNGSENSFQKMSKEKKQIFNLLAEKDSILFNLGFNHCDTTTLRNITSQDFEFYHDQAGITSSQQNFIQSISGL